MRLTYDMLATAVALALLMFAFAGPEVTVRSDDGNVVDTRKRG
jgi:hypothetical protein